MDDNARLQLQKMISTNNVVDQTEMIRNLKHSHILRENINQLILLKSKYMDTPEELHLEAMNECHFLFTYYTDIYNKIRKDEINLTILFRFLDVLKQIEDGMLDQHEGSFIVGKLLKEMYIDSALKKADKLNEMYDKQQEPVIVIQPVEINWKQYKEQYKEQYKF
jgi:hypothetical protein